MCMRLPQVLHIARASLNCYNNSHTRTLPIPPYLTTTIRGFARALKQHGGRFKPVRFTANFEAYQSDDVSIGDLGFGCQLVRRNTGISADLSVLNELRAVLERFEAKVVVNGQTVHDDYFK